MRASKTTNPKWIRDEELLLVDLYFACRDKIPGPKDPRVVELSELLFQSTWHSMSSRASSFRNPDGIALKLQNLKSVETGSGMRNTAAIDHQILYEFCDRRAELSERATCIRKAIELAQTLEIGEADLEHEIVFSEGRLLTAIHLRRERDPRLRKELLRARHKDDRCFCDLCGASFQSLRPVHRMAAFEVHHLLPLSTSNLSRPITVTEVSLLCAVCHRAIHSAIAAQGRWLDITEAKAVLMGRESL